MAAARRVNMALLALFVATMSTGVAMFAIGSEWNSWPTLIHGAAGLALVTLTRPKFAISRRGVGHRGLRSAAPSLTLAALVVVIITSGFAHRGGVREIGPLLVQQVHVGAALAAIPLMIWHVAVRPVRITRADLDRRALLRAGVLIGGSAAATTVLPAAGDRSTRSLERGSYEPRRMPVTQWLDDEVPDIDVDTWRLVVAGRSWTLEELEALSAAQPPREATLDCTGGWYAHQHWSGVPLDQLLDASAAETTRSIVVRSHTGYWRRFPAADAPHLLVATAVGGQALSPGHGAPARLVAPSRRGFWWVKWITSIEPSDTPWWWQPPFPLT